MNTQFCKRLFIAVATASLLLNAVPSMADETKMLGGYQVRVISSSDNDSYLIHMKAAGVDWFGKFIDTGALNLNSFSVFFIPAEQIKGNYVFWDLSSAKKGKHIGDPARGIGSVLGLNEVNCSDRKVRTVSMYCFSESMLEGERRKIKVSGEWRSPEPDSFEYFATKQVCGSK